MTPHELDRLSRVIFRRLSESVPSWREVPIAPDAPEELHKAPGYKRWHRDRFQRGEILDLFQSMFESNRKLIMDAGRYLEALGYQTTTIRSATPGTVRVANAGPWRLCVRIPLDTAERILILGFMPGM